MSNLTQTLITSLEIQRDGGAGVLKNGSKRKQKQPNTGGGGEGKKEKKKKKKKGEGGGGGKEHKRKLDWMKFKKSLLWVSSCGYSAVVRLENRKEKFLFLLSADALSQRPTT